MSLFSTKTGLRSVYKDLTAAALNATTGASDAILIDNISNAPKVLYIFNSTAMDLEFRVVHPEKDPSVLANRLLWMVMPANFNLNYDLFSGNLSIEPGTYIYISKVTGTTGTTGMLRLHYWG